MNPEGRLKISFLIHAMDAGGAERVMAILANGLAERGHEVSILTLAPSSRVSFYPLDDRVTFTPLALHGPPRRKGTFWTALLLIWVVRRLRRHLRCETPGVLVSFIDTTNILAVLATAWTGIPVVVSERTDPYTAPLKPVWRFLRAMAYPLSARLVVQSSSFLGFFPRRVQARTVVIPNPVLAPRGQDSPKKGSGSTILAMGRLSHEKGFDILLEAFQQVAGTHPGWSMEIWGEGPLRTELEQHIHTLGLQDRVSLPGITRDPQHVMAQADMFVLSSRIEGFPNVLCEAMASGLAVVAASCSGGVRDILRPGVDGLLVASEDPAGLAHAMAGLMEDPALRADLGLEARRIVERFSERSVLDQWESCLGQVMGSMSS